MCVWNINKYVLKLTTLGMCAGDRKELSLSSACQPCLGRFYCMAPAC